MEPQKTLFPLPPVKKRRKTKRICKKCGGEMGVHWTRTKESVVIRRRLCENEACGHAVRTAEKEIEI